MNYAMSMFSDIIYCELVPFEHTSQQLKHCYVIAYTNITIHNHWNFMLMILVSIVGCEFCSHNVVPITLDRWKDT